jgi:hypothetical protein
MTVECTIRVFKNRVPRRIFGPTSDDVRKEWRRLDKEELMICAPYQMLFE